MRAEGHQPHCARLAALHRRETGPWPMKQKNETDISGVSKPRAGASEIRSPVSETIRLHHPGITVAALGTIIFLITVR